MLAAESSAQEAVAAWDSTILHVKDAEGRATLAKREALERVLRWKTGDAAALTSPPVDAWGCTQKITLLEDKLAVER
jgi:hypothetical protein